MHSSNNRRVVRDIRKVQPLLDELESTKQNIIYFAVDLSKAALAESMAALSQRYRYVRCFSLWGDFEDAFTWLKSVQAPKCFLSLGSIFGNDKFDDAVSNLRKLASIMQPQDCMLLGIDACTDEKEIWESYHDPGGVFHNFIRNGLRHSNRILGSDWYQDTDWSVSGVLGQNPIQHKFVIKAQKDVKCEPLDLHFRAGDEIDCYESFKYGWAAMREQFTQAGLSKIAHWKSASGRIGVF